MLCMAFLLFRVAVGAEGFALDLDRSGSLGPLGSLGSGIFFNGSGGSRSQDVYKRQAPDTPAAQVGFQLWQHTLEKASLVFYDQVPAK